MHTSPVYHQVSDILRHSLYCILGYVLFLVHHFLKSKKYRLSDTYLILSS